MEQQPSTPSTSSTTSKRPGPVKQPVRPINRPASGDDVHKVAAIVSVSAQEAAGNTGNPGLEQALLALVRLLEDIQVRSKSVKGIGTITQDVDVLVKTATDFAEHNLGKSTLEGLQETIDELTSTWNDIRKRLPAKQTRIKRFFGGGMDATKLESLVRNIKSALQRAVLHGEWHSTPVGLDALIVQSSDHDILDDEEQLQPWVTRALCTLVSRWKLARQQSTSSAITQAPFSFLLAETVVVRQWNQHKSLWPEDLDKDTVLEIYHSIILAVAVSEDVKSASLASSLITVMARGLQPPLRWPPFDENTISTAFLWHLGITYFSRSAWKEKWLEWLAPNIQPPRFLEVTVPLIKAWSWSWRGQDYDVWMPFEEIRNTVFSDPEDNGLTPLPIIDLAVLRVACRHLPYGLFSDLDDRIKARLRAYRATIRLLRSHKSESSQAKYAQVSQRMADERVLLAYWACRADRIRYKYWDQSCWAFLRDVVMSNQMKPEYRRREETPAATDPSLGVAGGAGVRLKGRAA